MIHLLACMVSLLDKAAIDKGTKAPVAPKLDWSDKQETNREQLRVYRCFASSFHLLLPVSEMRWLPSSGNSLPPNGQIMSWMLLQVGVGFSFIVTEFLSLFLWLAHFKPSLNIY